MPVVYFFPFGFAAPEVSSVRFDAFASTAGTIESSLELITRELTEPSGPEGLHRVL